MATVAWVVVAETDLNDYLVGKGIDAFKTKALASGQADPFANTMHDVTNMIRGYIGKRYTLSATAYAIPPDMKWIACLLVVEAMQGRLPGVQLLDSQKSRLEDAREYLKLVNEGKVAIDAPTDPETSPALQIPGGIQVVSYDRHRLCPSQLRGL